MSRLAAILLLTGKILFWFFTVIILIIGLFYSVVPMYDFPEPQPFQGEQLFNPYSELDTSWWKGNFQVASYSWGGFTDGRDTADEVYQQYRSFGYNIISISDYQKINKFRSDEPDYVPTYERGYNVWKRHHLCIGARKVTWFDLPLFQSIHHKQYIINITKPHVEFLTIAHPIWMGAFTPEDLKKLTGYDALEVLNHYRNSVTLWDAALSAGKHVWMVGNDDSHDVFDLEQTMRYWTMINAPSSGQTDILEALRKGRCYGVDGRLGENKNGLQSLSIDSMTISLELDTVASVITFIGQDGQQMASFTDTSAAEYFFKQADTYIRTEIVTGGSKMYLNPVFRYDGNLNSEEQATINWTYTWIYRFVSLLIYGLIIYIFIQRKKILTRIKIRLR